MSTITVKDGTTIYYKDWGKGPVVTFSHGWPLNSDAWDGQLFFLAQNGFRVVAHDRRGHGRSSRHGPGTTWMAMPTTWQLSLRRSISRT
jgi:non-heme chloroperoxidase